MSNRLLGAIVISTLHIGVFCLHGYSQTIPGSAPPPGVVTMTATTSQHVQADLAGTSWQLVKFQGSDDSTLTPDDRAKYTITFEADGRMTARIDCNRGWGIWKSSGPNQIQFDPLAITRAKCPPGSLHDQIVRNWKFVRSYVLKDEHLFLSLMADGGIYEFEPARDSDKSASPFGKRWRLTEIKGAALKNQ